MNNTFIDLFSGAGGMIQARIKCLADVEYAKDAAATYWHNLCLGGWSKLFIDPNDEKLKTYVSGRYDRYIKKKMLLL